MEEQRDDLISKLNKAITDVEAARATAKDLQKELSAAESLANAAEKEIRRLKSQLNEMKASMEANGQSAGAEVADLRSKVEELKQQLLQKVEQMETIIKVRNFSLSHQEEDQGKKQKKKHATKQEKKER